MKHIQTFNLFEMYYKDKVKMLIPETYIMFSYRSYSYVSDKYFDYLIFGKVNTEPEYDITTSNTFASINVIDIYTNNPKHFNFSNKFNVDVMRPIKQSESLEDIKMEFEREKEKWKIKEQTDKYNI